MQRGWVWVAWRWSATHIGWAPLPPEAVNANGFNSGVDDSYDIGAGSYVFIPRDSFCDVENYAQRVAAAAANKTKCRRENEEVGLHSVIPSGLANLRAVCTELSHHDSTTPAIDAPTPPVKHSAR